MDRERKETLDAIYRFHQCYPDNKYSELDPMDYNSIEFCGITENRIIQIRK